MKKKKKTEGQQKSLNLLYIVVSCKCDIEIFHSNSYDFI